jgi:hypothetical protein
VAQVTAPNVEPEAQDAPELASDYPELPWCSKCHDGTFFVRGEDGTWESECCGWPPVQCDPEPPDA